MLKMISMLLDQNLFLRHKMKWMIRMDAVESLISCVCCLTIERAEHISRTEIIERKIRRDLSYRLKMKLICIHDLNQKLIQHI